MFKGNQYFFLGEIINGYLGSGQGEEYKAVNRKRGTYQPLWVEINSLRTIDVRPKEVIEKILSYLNKKG
jgi:8-oxo-dGTP diphosphatase